MKHSALIAALLLSACATHKPQPFAPVNESGRAEYASYLVEGGATLRGQAFLTQRGGGTVKAAGRKVTLDPATSIGRDWWQKAGKTYAFSHRSPPAEEFLKARRSTTADADGRFRFDKLPPGNYFVRTEVTWEVGGYNPIQGGALGRMVTVPASGEVEVVLSEFAQ